MSVKDELRRVFIFDLADDVYENVYRLVIRNSKEQFFQKGELVASPGEYPEYIFILLDGMVKCLSYSEVGEDMPSTLFHSKGGRVFLIIPCISNAKLHSYYTAATKSRILLIPREDFITAMNSYPEFKDRIMMHLCRVSEARLMHMYMLEHKKASHRVRAYLLDRSSRMGSNIIDDFYSIEALAGYLNLSRPALSRELNAMEKQGVLELKRGCIIILDAEKLQNCSL